MRVNQMSIQQKNESTKKKIARYHIAILIGCVVLLMTSFMISMNAGYTRLTPFDTLRTLLGGGSFKENLILFDFRLPRIVISMVVGLGLALSGCVIQSISGNALADPGLLGINAGAGLMVILYVLLFGTKTFFSVFSMPFLALFGAGIAALTIYVLAHKRVEGLAPMRLILTGVAVQAGISSLTTVLVVKLDETQFDFVASWQAGSIWGSNWKFVLALLPWLMILIPLVMRKTKVLDIITLGDGIATGLGVSVEKERRTLFGLAVALAASCVAVSGGISFVGLISPHLAKRLVGPRHRILLPTCAMVGAVLVSFADTLARTLLQPAELPTGIMVAMIGAPYFLYLLIRSKS